MAAGSTYTPIATTTLGTAAASYTFSSISGSYTDLVLVVAGTNTSAGGRSMTLVFNSDTGTNYSSTYLSGDGSAASSGRYTSTAYIDTAASIHQSTISNAIVQIQNYSNATTYKTALTRGNNSAVVVRTSVGLWRSTSAITSVKVGLTADNWAVGTTFTLYGIAAA